nr:PREDICTED: THAP domain-containing protein 1-like [Tribolium castaneum]|eukprot:XP_015839706.1 PREDICTED: THAP domain-containing protein 1-like [Tribolium castaneum]
MPATCAAYGCTNRHKKGGNISFHSFPNDESLRRKWVIAMKREHFEPSKYSKLCSDHFKKDFVFTFGLKTLKLGTVPTIFNFPSHLLKKEPKERSTRLRNFENDGNSVETLVETVVTNVVTESETGVSEVSVTSSSTSHQEQQPSTSTVPEETLEPQFVSKQEGTKRKRSQPIYVGDFSQATETN